MLNHVISHHTVIFMFNQNHSPVLEPPSLFSLSTNFCQGTCSTVSGAVGVNTVSCLDRSHFPWCGCGPVWYLCVVSQVQGSAGL